MRNVAYETKAPQGTEKTVKIESRRFVTHGVKIFTTELAEHAEGW
jgi:hypothetical protein